MAELGFKPKSPHVQLSFDLHKFTRLILSQKNAVNKGISCSGLPDLHASIRAQKCKSQHDCLALCWNTGEALRLFKLPRDVRNQDLGWGRKDLSKPSWDFSLWTKLLLSPWGEEIKLMRHVVWGQGCILHCFSQGNGASHPLWFLLIPMAEIMEMRSSIRLCLRQRSSEGPEDEDVRLKLEMSLASRSSHLYTWTSGAPAKALLLVIYHQPLRNPPLRASGWLSWLSIWLLISAQVMILGSWGWAPHQVPHSAQSLLKILFLPLSLPLAQFMLALSLSLNQSIKSFFKKRNKPSSYLSFQYSTVIMISIVDAYILCNFQMLRTSHTQPQ